MKTINLLPWREEQRAQHQRQFVSWLGSSALASLLLVALIHMQVNSLIDDQGERNRYLKQQISLVEKQITEVRGLRSERERMFSRMEVVQKLQRNRTELVYLFEDLARAVPDGVVLTELSQKQALFELKGIAKSNASVSQLMRNLEQSRWFYSPRLEVIHTKLGREKLTRDNRFTLHVNHRISEQSPS